MRPKHGSFVLFTCTILELASHKSDHLFKLFFNSLHFYPSLLQILYLHASLDLFPKCKLGDRSNASYIDLLFEEVSIFFRVRQCCTSPFRGRIPVSSFCWTFHAFHPPHSFLVLLKDSQPFFEKLGSHVSCVPRHSGLVVSLRSKGRVGAPTRSPSMHTIVPLASFWLLGLRKDV